MTIIKPSRLQKGDTIGIVAPSGPVQKQMLDKGVHYLESKGFEIVLGNNVHKCKDYLAGSDEERLRDFMAMFSDSSINGIFIARGGYGSSRLLHRIDYDCIRDNPKILVGYSDATALQMALYSKAGIITFSGPMVAIDFGMGEIPVNSESHFWDLLYNNQRANHLHDYNSHELSVVNEGCVEGPVICGCLSVFLNCLDTPYCPDLNGAILVLEDIDEDLYKIDRAFTALQHRGVFRKINGLVLGHFNNSNIQNKDMSGCIIENIVKPLLQEFNVPALANLDYGHIPGKLTLPNGVHAKIDTNKKIFDLLENSVI